MAKAEDQRVREIEQLLTDPIVDLDVYGEGATTYTVTDAAGVTRSFDLPNDPPFPVAAAFFRAHDEWARLQGRLLGASERRDSPQNRAALAKVESQIPAAWDRLMEAFAAIVSIRLPETTSGWELSEQIGGAAIEQWIGTVLVRLQIRRMGPDIGEVIGRLLRGGGTQEDAVPFASPSDASSEPSDGSTAGGTTTGARSDGSSSGGPRRSSSKRPTPKPKRPSTS